MTEIDRKPDPTQSVAAMIREVLEMIEKDSSAPKGTEEALTAVAGVGLTIIQEIYMIRDATQRIAEELRRSNDRESL